MHVFQLNAEADYEVRPRFRTQRGSYNSGGRLDQRNTRTTGRANKVHRLEPMQLSFGLEQLASIRGRSQDLTIGCAFWYTNDNHV